MRPVLATVLRAVFALASMAVSMVSGLIVARFLAPSEYGFYQAVRRSGQLLGPFTTIVSWWGYRYAGLGKHYAKAVLASTLYGVVLGLLTGVAASHVLGRPGVYALAAAVYLATYASFTMLVPVLDAVRPVRRLLLTLVSRLVMLASVVLLVYMLGLKTSIVVLAAASLAFGSAALAAAKYLAERVKPGESAYQVIREWFRSAHIPLVNGLSAFIAGLDAILVAWLAGVEVVAAYYAATLPARIFTEVAGASMLHLQAYMLSGGVASAVERSASLLMVALAPLAAAFVSWSHVFVSLVNPSYIWASAALKVHSVIMLLAPILGSVSAIALGLDKSDALKPGRVLKAAAAVRLVASMLYLGLVAALVKTYGVVGWAFAELLKLVATVVGFIVLEPRAAHAVVHVLLRSIIAVPALIVAHHVQPEIHVRFWSQAAAIAESFTFIVPVYLLTLLDPVVRQAIVKTRPFTLLRPR